MTKAAHQYLIRDHQQLNYPKFKVTDKHYSSLAACRQAWESNGPEFKVERVVPESRVDDPHIVEIITRHEEWVGEH